MSQLSQRASSIRSRHPAETLVAAKLLGRELGITRVTDISGLDRFDIPVFASINPSLKVDTVTYGKGATALDAEVGAYMESIEFAIAQDTSRNTVQTKWGTPLDVVGAEDNPEAILDFCPIANTEVELTAPLKLARAIQADNGQTVWLPAELVFFPLDNPGQRLFGSSTNGLASGNNLLEASVHGLYEIIERDIASFQHVKQTEENIALSTLPAISQQLVESILSAGFLLSVQFVQNSFGMGYFVAYLWHPSKICEKFFCAGWGCHLNNSIALNRAICEAVQSHTAAIHGARNFTQSTQYNPHLAGKISQRYAADLPTRSFTSLPEAEVGSLEEQWLLLQEKVKSVTGFPVYQVPFTSPQSTLQVVRIVAPGMESFRPGMMRIGRRIKHFLETQTGSHL